MKKLALCLALVLGALMLGKSQSKDFFMMTYVSPQALVFGQWDSLTSVSVTNAATMDVVFPASYSSYKLFYLFISVKPITDNTNLLMLVSADGSTYDNSSNQYNWNLSYGSGTAAGQPDVMIQLIGNCGSGTGYHNDGAIIFQSAASATQRPLFEYHLSETDANGTNAPINGVATRLAQQVTKALRFKYSSGNITGYAKLMAAY